jgi:hypothetical protein
LRQHADAVRVVAAEIGLDKLFGHQRGFLIVGTGRNTDHMNRAAQFAGGNKHFFLR